MPPIPKMMKAIRVEEKGGPEVNVLKEIPVPEPKEGELLIKVEYTGVNYIDNYFRSGLYPKDIPYTVGQDAIGTIVSLPSSPPSNLSIGQRVLSLAPSAFAEYLTAPAHKVAPFPDSLRPEEGVAMCSTAFTAMMLVKECYEVKKGDWILVRAAAGGVGILLCQLCAHIGANVIGTTSSATKADLAKQNGAHHVLLITDSSADVVKKVQTLTGGEGVHCVFDGVGKDTWEEDFEVVRRKGSIITFGNASGAVPAFAPLKLAPKGLKVMRPTMFTFLQTVEEYNQYAKWVFDALKEGAFRIHIHKVYGFTAEEVAQAQRDISSRETTGKLVVQVA